MNENMKVMRVFKYVGLAGIVQTILLVGIWISAKVTVDIIDTLTNKPVTKHLMIHRKNKK